MGSPTSFAATLGLQPMAYVPNLTLAPPPRKPTLRRPLVVADTRRPTERADNPADMQRAAANISGLAVAVVLLDHHSRQLQGLAKMPHDTAALLSRFVRLADDVLVKMVRQFDGADTDSINALSDVLGQASELLLQLRVPQIEASLKHMATMAETNLTYTPATV
ncbi:MAG: hypothetical protein ACRYFX_18615 [Janthinobacterium lividum]